MSRFLMRMLPVLLLLPLAFALFVPGGAPPAAAQETYSISGRVINDLNGDGVQQPGEPGLADWHLRLEMNTEDGQPSVARETTSEKDGHYSFSGLPRGDYDVVLLCEGQPSLWVGTGESDQGSISITLDSGMELKNVDFRVSLLNAPPPGTGNGSILGRLVWDENRDGVLDPSEPGVTGWQITAGKEYQTACFTVDPQVLRTGLDGSFAFAGLLPGRYFLNNPDPAGASAPTYWALDAPGEADQSGWFSLTREINVPADGSVTIDIGVVSLDGTGSISGSIYSDLNGNGVRDPDDPLRDCDCMQGLAYRTPNGYDVVQGANGNHLSGSGYEIAALSAGYYRVAILFGPGLATYPPRGPEDWPEYGLTLGEGERRTNVDFLFAPHPDEPTGEVIPTEEVALVPTPVPSGDLTSPTTGSGGAPSDGGLAGLAAALAVAGALAVSGSVLVGLRWRARFRR